MLSFKNLAVVLPVLAPLASAFDAQSRSNVAVYYGQGYNQDRLSHFCADTSLDIINIGFVNIFPDQGEAGWPGTNFGNQCDGLTYQVGNVSTELLSGCHQLIEDIPICQAAGKKVLLSLGGGTPDTQLIESSDSAILFADFLWGAFGPKVDEWVEYGGPRPFGDVVVDGFDFDIEHNGGFGYDIMINRLREHFAEVTNRKFYISGAPQCSIPDEQLSQAISNSAFDFIWVQWYNSWGCSARDYFPVLTDIISDIPVVSNILGFNFDAWVNVIKNSANPSAKLYIGLPGSETAANSPLFYLSPDEVETLVSKYMDRYPSTFGGVMIWEATYSENNQIDGVSYADKVKEILTECAPAPSVTPSPSSTPVPSPSKTPTPSSSPVASQTPSVSATATPTASHSPSTTPSHSSPVVPTSSPTISTKPGPSTSASSSAVPSSSPASSSTDCSESPTPSGSSVVSGTPSSSKPAGSGTPSSSGISTTSTPAVHTSPYSSKPGHSTASSSSQIPGSSSSVSANQPSTGATTTTSKDGSSTTPTVSTSEPATVTTVIVTSYTNICPTGFTTITTTYTTTYCPGTVSATATVTNPSSVPGSPTTAPTPPEGWTTTVTVCTHCAATPTTVTLTLPVATATEALTKPGSQTTVPAPPEGWTTTVSVCTDCAPVPTTVTLTVPVVPTGTEAIPSISTTSAPAGNNGGTGGQDVPTAPGSTETVTVILPPARTTSSRPLIHGTSTVRPSSTLHVKPSPTPSGSPSGSTVPVASSPSGTQEGVSPVFTGAASQAAGLGHGVALFAAVILSVFTML